MSEPPLDPNAQARQTAPVASDPAFVELLQRLNDGWRIAGSPTPRTFKQRVGYQVRRVLARLLGTQETFNAAVVQFVNTVNSASGPVLAALDEVDRHRDALAARERRVEAAMARLLAEHEEIRTSIAVLRQAQALAAAAAPSAGTPVAAGAAGSATGGAPAPRTPDTATALSHKYVAFEDRFRGEPEDIRARQADYASIFAGLSDVLDVGCGRGEFLALLRERGIRAAGLDLNAAMVAVCREQGLDAVHADALAYLRGQPAGSLGGLMAAQVVEHMEPAYLVDLLDAAHAALRPGAPIVLETINPACWFAFFESYVRDITHVRPLHPDTLGYLLAASGFARVEIRYRAPYPEHDKLQPIPASPTLGDAVETLNANAAKINRLLFTHLDYAAIAYRS